MSDRGFGFLLGLGLSWVVTGIALVFLGAYAWSAITCGLGAVALGTVMRRA